MHRASHVLLTVVVVPALAAFVGGLCPRAPAALAQSPEAAGPAPSTGPAGPATAAAPKPQRIVSRRTGPDGAVVAQLSNGLTAIVKSTRTAPVVCVRAYVKAGGIYEGRWLGAGLSHLVEHLVAKGAVHGHTQGHAATESPKETRSRVDEIGGQSNAWTSLSETCYYISASSARTMDCVDLIADWLARPDITRDDFRREHGVVQRELETSESEGPAERMWHAHARDFFCSHPASVPVIGFRGPLRRLTYQDVLAYHRKMYVPQHMAVAVVGDVDTEAVLGRLCKALAGFEKGRTPRLLIGAVPHVSSTRRNVYSHPGIKDTMERISFRTVELMHDDLYPLDVLSYVLTTGRASRLVEKIQRRKKLVTSIYSGSWTPHWGAGMFTLGYRADCDKADRAEKAVLDELRSVIADGVTAEELARAKRQKVADFVYSQQTVESQAATLASDCLATGDPWFSAHYTKRIQSVTAAEVRAVAGKYFDFDRMVITRLVPADRLKAQAAKTAATRKAAATAFKLPNDLRVVLYPTEAVRLVAMTFVTRGGVMRETDETNGLGALMTALSTRGAGKRSAREIAAFFDEAGGSITGKCGNNTFYWQASVLDDRVEGALEILADVIRRPRFEAEELDRLRPVLGSAVEQIDEDWYRQLYRFWRRKFFGGLPYERIATGSKEVIGKATAKQVAAYHREAIRPGGSVLAIYGHFETKAVRAQVERLFADMPKGEARVPAGQARKVRKGGELYTLKTHHEQTAGIIVAVPGMKLDQLDDRLAMNVLDTIISGYQLPSGWLHRELRGKRLVYVVHAYNWAGLAPGAFVTYAACQPDKAEEVIEIIQRNLRRAASYTPTAEEVRRAVNTILTAELLDRQPMSDLAMAAALDELYGFGYNFRSRLDSLYRKITPQDVRQVGGKYLSGDFVVVVATPKPQELRPAKEPAK